MSGVEQQGMSGQRVVLLLIPDEDFAWEVFEVASEQYGVARALMVNADHPGSIEEILDSP